MRLVALALVLALADAGTVEPRGFSSHVEPTKVHLGEPFTYPLQFQHAPGERYELRLPADLGVFELLEQKRHREDAAAGATTTFQVQLSAFELGKQRLPDLTFDVVSESGVGRFVAPGRDVEVETALSAEVIQKGADLFDIRPPEDVPIRTYRLLYALAGLLVAGALAVVGVRAWRRRGARVPPPTPPRALSERTRAALDALGAEDRPAQGKVKEFYFRLSEILRGYLGERYGVDALESTSTELLAALRRLAAPGLPLEELARFTLESDLVKFARSQVGPQECAAALQLGYLLIERTPVPVTTAVPP